VGESTLGDSDRAESGPGDREDLVPGDPPIPTPGDGEAGDRAGGTAPGSDEHAGNPYSLAGFTPFRAAPTFTSASRRVSKSGAVDRDQRRSRTGRQALSWAMIVLGTFLLLSSAWVFFRAYQAYSNLQAAAQLVTELQGQISDVNGPKGTAVITLESLQKAASSASTAAHDPLFRAASVLPWVGTNLDAVTTIAETVDTVAVQVLPQLVDVADTFSANNLVPKDGAIDLAPIIAIAPTLRTADAAVDSAIARMTSIDRNSLIRPVGDAVTQLSTRLRSAQVLTDVGARVATLLPPMMGSEGPRTYLFVFQNLAEPRATGGFLGSFALLHVQDGRVTVGEAGRAGRQLGMADPPIQDVDPALVSFYGQALTLYPGSANFSPDYPTGAELFTQMYTQRTGESVDGMIATDPVALSYVLKGATPIDVGGGVKLDASSLADFFLRDIYAKFANEPDQSAREAFTATATATIASKVLGGDVAPASLVEGVRKAVTERRILIWSAHADEEATLTESSLAGAIPTGADGGTTIGVYLNDGSGAKLGYYLHPEVSIKPGRCETDGTRQIELTVTLVNTSPASGLPSYVAGGTFFTPPYVLRTNVVVMAPVNGGIISAEKDGSTQPIGSGVDHSRSMGAITVDLGPGQSSTLTLTIRTSEALSAGAALQPVLSVTPLRATWAQSVEPLPACT
jgi:hypothetical protein